MAKTKTSLKKLRGNRGGQWSADWRNIIFRPEQLVGFKQDVDSYLSPVYSAQAQFFVLNPLKDLRSAFDANVAAHQNFLLELDWRGLSAQEKQIEGVLGMPYTMKTYSGGKSLHYIISLDTPMTPTEWRETVQFLLFVAKKADPKCKNPARLTRTPNAVRPTDGVGVTQELVHLESSPLAAGEFKAWLASSPLEAARIAYELKKEHEAEQRRLQRERSQASGEPPRWIVELLEKPLERVHKGSRHATLVNVAVTLYGAGFSLEEYIEPRLLELAFALDKTEDEVYSILNWVERNVQIGIDE